MGSVRLVWSRMEKREMPEANETLAERVKELNAKVEEMLKAQTGLMRCTVFAGLCTLIDEGSKNAGAEDWFDHLTNLSARLLERAVALIPEPKLKDDVIDHFVVRKEKKGRMEE